MSIRPSRPPFKGGFCNKNTPFVRATKINKNQWLSFVFALMKCSKAAFGEQNKRKVNELVGDEGWLWMCEVGEVVGMYLRLESRETFGEALNSNGDFL